MLIELTAAQLLEMVVDGFIAAGAGKLTEAALPKLQTLWRKIRDRLARRPELPALPETPTGAIDVQAVAILDAELVNDPPFAEEVRAIAQELRPLVQQAQSQAQQQADHAGVNVIASDQSTVKAIGSIQADGDVNINF
ncbi:hypothetical protein H6G52_03355 [Limnothrix sp. FACHB-881]|uniref:hypothetical protein n=1 Tax=Limnothrix sp. FACHB-881 TaxID=2692819 RepID=UPI001689DA4B|nr:hypothetical protein [Limnothrix sp. FACHB-881]MBD2634387.1 hypothetical protein [Limnothrix sp. FACHB-881]